MKNSSSGMSHNFYGNMDYSPLQPTDKISYSVRDTSALSSSMTKGAVGGATASAVNSGGNPCSIGVGTVAGAAGGAASGLVGNVDYHYESADGLSRDNGSYDIFYAILSLKNDNILTSYR